MNAMSEGGKPCEYIESRNPRYRATFGDSLGFHCACQACESCLLSSGNMAECLKF